MAEITAPPAGFERARKRSVTIAGHETSIALEPVFWAALEAAASDRGLPLNALVAEVDALRILHARPPSLASALRTWSMAATADLPKARTVVDGGNGSR